MKNISIFGYVNINMVEKHSHGFPKFMVDNEKEWSFLLKWMS